MSTLRTTKRLIAALAEESWSSDHERALECRELEDWIDVVIPLFTITKSLESCAQERVCRGEVDAAEIEWSDIWWCYRALTKVLEHLMSLAESLGREGFAVDRIEELRTTSEEARTLVDLLSMEDELPPFEELLRLSQPEDPRPGRYD